MVQSKPQRVAAHVHVSLAVLVVGAACNTDRLDTVEQVSFDADERLESAVKEEFGEEAILRRVIGEGDEVILGIATTAPEPDSDGIPQVALANYHTVTGALSVIERSETYRGARPVGDALAVLTDQGELTVREPDGSVTTAPVEVKGDLAPAPDGSGLAMTLAGTTPQDGETAVALFNRNGELTVAADAPGVDDRPALSPDGVTLVFVSGRTGVASFWKTTVDGAEPVQITNHDIQVGVEREGEPVGFVPPPVNSDQLTWLDAETIRYDAGGGEMWRVNINTGEAYSEGEAR